MPSPKTRAFTSPRWTKYTLGFPSVLVDQTSHLNFQTWELPAWYLGLKVWKNKDTPISLPVRLPGQRSRFWLMLEKQSSDEKKYPKHHFQAHVQILKILIWLSLTTPVHLVWNFCSKMLLWSTKGFVSCHVRAVMLALQEVNSVQKHSPVYLLVVWCDFSRKMLQAHLSIAPSGKGGLNPSSDDGLNRNLCLLLRKCYSSSPPWQPLGERSGTGKNKLQ